MNTKLLACGLAALVGFGAVAQEAEHEPLPLHFEPRAARVSTEIKNVTGTLSVAFQRVEGVNPPDQMALVLVTPGGTDIKHGHVKLNFDGKDQVQNALCEEPVEVGGNVVEVVVCYLAKPEMERLAVTKALGIAFDGKKGRATFHIQNADVRLKKFIEHSMGGGVRNTSAAPTK